jgi:Deoxycytidine deaminase
MLSDHRILKERIQGNIVIEPFDERQLGTNSYDCRLGTWYFAQEAQGQDLDLFSEGVREAWGEPRKASKRGIPVRPGETILAHTLETVGGRNGYLACMRTRSTVARSCLDVCGSAGLGDVSYIAVWTLEIRNMSRNTIWLPTGGRILQMEFHYVGETLKHYDGHYGQEEVFDPYSMLPNSKPDWAVEEYRENMMPKEVKIAR